MKKEYVTPSTKVMKIEMNAMVMTSGNAKEDVDWTSSESTDVGLTDFGNSNGDAVDWDF